MKIAAIIQPLEELAPLSLQESYDNAGLICGDPDSDCTGVLCSLDITEAVLDEAIQKGCNLLVAHHPVIFRGLKKLTGSHYVERIIIKAIRQGLAIYAIHTNLDNVKEGVSHRMARVMGIEGGSVLEPRLGTLKKLYSFVPVAQLEQVRSAVFAAGAGHIGNYSECSFSATGTGTFKGGADTHPFVGKPGERHYEEESKIEFIFPAHREKAVLKALLEAHPYEEVAYDLLAVTNTHPGIGSGWIGELPVAVEEQAFLLNLKNAFGLATIRHTRLTGRPVKKIALCGGAGSFLISNALSAGADVFISADIKYHEFFEADGRMLICDIGHFESEQFTVDLLADILQQKFPTFAVLKSDQLTNPVYYY